MFSDLLFRIRAWFRRDKVEADLDAELRAHLENEIAKHIAAGVPQDEAARRARLSLGGLEQIKEDFRDARGLNLIDTTMQDIRYALRIMRRSPAFTSVAILSLALGVGATTAIFSLVNTLLLHNLPVHDPRRLVELLHRYPGEPALNGFSPQAYQLIRDHNDVFSGLMASNYQPFHIAGQTLDTQIVNGAYIDKTFFQVLGVQAAIGRLLGPEDQQSNDPPAVAVLSWSFWKSRFHLDPAILGQQITVENLPVTIVGVAPQDFLGLQVESNQDIWLPLALEPVILSSSGSQTSFSLVARLKTGVSVEQARAEIAVLYESTLDEQAKATNNPFLRKMKFEIAPAGAGLSRLREQFARPLLALMAIVSVLLLIACTNVASMLLARGAAREHEMALRVSLGAGRSRLLRQGLTESLLLSAAGTLLGITFAYFGTAVLVRIILAVRRPGPPIQFQVQTDGNLLIFTVALALLTCALFGLFPALRALRSTPASSLHQPGTSSQTKFGRLVGKSLVVAQVALSVVLLSAAGLFVRYLSNLQHLDLGFQRDHVLLVSLDPTHSGYDDAQLSRAYQQLLARLEAVPGVRSATLCAMSPIQGNGANRAIAVEGYQSKPGEIRNVMENWVAPKYFATLGTPLLAGRDFSPDDQGRSRVAIVNQSMARYYFGGRSPIGKHLLFEGDDQPYEIVGVVGDAKYYDLREASWRTIYLDTFQQNRVASEFALRTSVDPTALAPTVRGIVRDLLKNVSLGRITTLADQVDASIVPERLIATLSAWFGALGSLLTAVGLYGLLAYTVARRINEIGIRMALGATRSHVTRTVLGDALVMVCLGSAIGAPIAFWGKSLANKLIADLHAQIAIPIAFAAASMIAVALLATVAPARRASRVDPIIALRYE